MKTKVSSWLNDINPWVIYDHHILSKEFEDMTGMKAHWPTHSAGSTAARIGTFKGPEYVTSLDHEKVCYGYEIAEAIERKLLGTDSGALFHGRGSRFDAAVRAVENAGL